MGLYSGASQPDVCSSRGLFSLFLGLFELSPRGILNRQNALLLSSSLTPKLVSVDLHSLLQSTKYFNFRISSTLRYKWEKMYKDGCVVYKASARSQFEIVLSFTTENNILPRFYTVELRQIFSSVIILVSVTWKVWDYFLKLYWVKEKLIQEHGLTRKKYMTSTEVTFKKTLFIWYDTTDSTLIKHGINQPLSSSHFYIHRFLVVLCSGIP